MRTGLDLDHAFVLLEQQADNYTSASSEAPDAPIELSAVTPHRRHLRRVATGVAAAIIAAAAVVAAIALGVGTGDDRNGAADPGPRLNDGPAPRSIPISVDPALGMRILEASTSRAFSSVELFSRSMHAEVTLFAQHSKVIAPGMERVDVNGHTGYYDNGTSPGFVEQPGDPTTQGPVATPTPPETRYARSVIFEYRPHSWALVVLQGRIGTKSGLLRIARTIHVGGTHLLRSAVSLSAAPAGMHLSLLDSSYRAVDDNAPFDLTGDDWYTSLDYSPNGTGHGIHVEATSYDITRGWHGGQATMVAGHRAYWLGEVHELDVDFGNGAYLDVSEDDDGRALTLTRAQIVAVTRTVALTTHPTRPGSWFNARTALP